MRPPLVNASTTPLPLPYQTPPPASVKPPLGTSVGFSLDCRDKCTFINQTTVHSLAREDNHESQPHPNQRPKRPRAARCSAAARPAAPRSTTARPPRADRDRLRRLEPPLPSVPRPAPPARDGPARGEPVPRLLGSGAGIQNPSFSRRWPFDGADDILSPREVLRSRDEDVHRNRDRGKRQANLQAFRGNGPSTGITTSRSMSLSGPASPRAWEPNRIICSGWNFSTIRFTMRSMCPRTVVPFATLATWTSFGLRDRTRDTRPTRQRGPPHHPPALARRTCLRSTQPRQEPFHRSGTVAAAVSPLPLVSYSKSTPGSPARTTPMT